MSVSDMRDHRTSCVLTAPDIASLIRATGSRENVYATTGEAM
jgi:hypothetical protein